jgi:hypothetical protein
MATTGDPTPKEMTQTPNQRLSRNDPGPGKRKANAEAEVARIRRRKENRNTTRLALADRTDEMTTGELQVSFRRR